MPSLAAARTSLVYLAQRARFHGSGRYWERRYRKGGTSGVGSYGDEAEYKAEFLNRFVAENSVHSVIELGCGDGNQLELANYPAYLGLDVSRTAVGLCLSRFAGDPSKSFLYYEPQAFSDPARFLRADLTISLDVVFHLVEDSAFDRYMSSLFSAADRFVIVYARDSAESGDAPHVKQREYTSWVSTYAPEWAIEHVESAPGRFKDFTVFGR